MSMTHAAIASQSPAMKPLALGGSAVALVPVAAVPTVRSFAGSATECRAAGTLPQMQT
jgi:hypothetical protein